MIRILILALFSLTICSCVTSHFLKIESNKSAFVESDAYQFDSIRLSKSKIISELKFKDGWYSFKISDIDSLGNYMGNIISDNYFTFRCYPDSLVITSNGNQAVKKEWNGFTCCNFNLKIETEKKIKKIITVGKGVKVIDKKSDSPLIFWVPKKRKNRVKRLVIIY